MVKIFKLGIFLAFFTSSCGGKTTSFSPTKGKQNPHQNAPSNQEQISSSGGSSSTSNPSNATTPPPIASEYDLGTNLDPNATSYANNVLTTPLFKLTYDDSASASFSRKNHQWKEEFLKQQYALFLENVTFSNEVYTLDKVIFRLRKPDGSQKKHWWVLC